MQYGSENFYKEHVADGAQAVSDPNAELTDRSVRIINRLMTARAYWKIPEQVLESVPRRLVAYIEKLDIETESRAFDRAVRCLCRLIDQNIAQGRQEIQFLGQPGRQPPQETAELPAEAPQQIAHLESPSLQDAAKTAQILHDLGIFTDIAKGTAEQPDNVVEGQAREPSD